MTAEKKTRLDGGEHVERAEHSQKVKRCVKNAEKGIKNGAKKKERGSDCCSSIRGG